MDDVDEIAVERAVRGERIPLTRAERRVVAARRRVIIARLTRRGFSGQYIAEHLRITRRQVVRHRTALREAA